MAIEEKAASKPVVKLTKPQEYDEFKKKNDANLENDDVKRVQAEIDYIKPLLDDAHDNDPAFSVLLTDRLTDLVFQRDELVRVAAVKKANAAAKKAERELEK